MRIHRNAKTTPATRQLLAHRVLHEGWTLSAASAAVGVSRQTGHKWIRRYQAGGFAALEDRSSVPHQQPQRTSPSTTAAIIALRYRRLSAWAIAQRLQVPRSTVALVLARLVPPPPVRRYERSRPSELLHLDTKQLARIGAVGHRIHGDQARKTRGVGWEYAQVCVDDYSRVAYVEVLPDRKGGTAAGFLRRCVRWFARRSVTVERVFTDNDKAYLSHAFQRVAARAHIRRLRTRPYRPQTNGKAERFIQTMLREWAYATPYPTSCRRTHALRPWLRFYNTERPHTSLGYRPPTARLPRAEQ